MKFERTDRVLYWPVILCVAWPVAFILTWAGPFDLAFYGGPLVIALWALSAGIATLICLAWLYLRTWRRFLSTMILPLSALIAALNPQFVWRTGQWAGDYVHFYAMLPIYLIDISRLPTDEPRFMLQNWGGFFPVVSHGIVYDESDEITKPTAEQSEAWKKRTKPTDADCVYGHTPIGHHFYFVALDC
jgi:hypothetical protein